MASKINWWWWFKFKLRNPPLRYRLIYRFNCWVERRRKAALNLSPPF